MGFGTEGQRFRAKPQAFRPPLSRGEVGKFSDVWETGRNQTVTYRLPTRVVAKENPENAVTTSTLRDFGKGGTQIRTGVEQIKTP